MMNKGTPGVILKCRFEVSGSKKFSEYINYIDRDSATRNRVYVRYSSYMDYMDNPEKTSALFTAERNQLRMEEKKALKEGFKTAQKNNAVLWQMLYSFDNKWLEEAGLYNGDTGKLQEEKIMAYTKKGIRSLLEKEGLEASAIWSAAIHYNTDNIHVHIAITEPIPLRKQMEVDGRIEYRGKMKQGSLNAAKSVMVNEILREQPENLKINEIMRSSILGTKKERPIFKDRKLREGFLDIYTHLPKDRRLWKYNNNAMRAFRPQLDRLTTAYIEKYHEKEFAELRQLLKKQEKRYKGAYGEKSRAGSFSENQMQDLYSRMGNAILREMREYSRREREGRITSAEQRAKAHYIHWQDQLAHRRTYELDRALFSLKRALKSEFEQRYNMFIYEKLEAEKEM